MSTSIDSVLERMERLGVGDTRELKGCTSNEIKRLEKKYELVLPETYRAYLRVMGHDSARLFAHDRVLVAYNDIVRLTVQAREDLAAWSDDCTSKSSKFTLPKDALVVLYRDSCDDYNFIRCNRSDDSSLWHFNQGLWPPRAFRRSVITWLSSWCDECAEAVKDGYFG